MAYAVRIKKEVGGDFGGLFMTYQEHDGREVLTFQTKKLAQEFLKDLYKGENWEVVKLNDR